MLEPLAASKSIDSHGNLVLSRQCRVTCRLASVTVTLHQYHRWQGGELSQDVWPDLTYDQREFIQTGYTTEEWDKIFADSAALEEWDESP